MKKLALAWGIAGLLFAIDLHGQTTEAAGTGCGTCAEENYPFPPYQLVHRLDPGSCVECSGGSGHPVHDCANGDPPGTHADGGCDTHAACGGGDAFVAPETEQQAASLHAPASGQRVASLTVVGRSGDQHTGNSVVEVQAIGTRRRWFLA